jgi:hypothetical protein
MTMWYFQNPMNVCVQCHEYEPHNCYVCITCCECDMCMYESGRLDLGEEE